MDADVLSRFSPATREWFATSFEAPTAAQAGAWASISTGAHTLVVAPTGSGKTLAAFLWSIDRLASEPVPEDALARCRVLYVSPLKALAVDVERNLRSPLVGVGHAAARLGLTRPDIGVAVRSGDTPADERRRFAKTPSDILITTPESLFLMLTSSVREALRGVQTVIVDEIHAVAGTKRGAHLAVSLDRLDALLAAPAQRIGLSATVRPVDEVARFLAGGRPVTIVDPPTDKQWDLQVVVPVPDLGALGEVTGDLSGPAAGDPRRTSIWPHVEEKIVDLVEAHRSTLVFANSRRLAERLTGRLNEIEAERREEASTDGGGGQGVAGRQDAGDEVVRVTGGHGAAVRPPALMMGQAGASGGAPPVLARAHHGSVSHEQRKGIEEDLKAGRLPAVVATSSLELGIDMGAIDLVVQVEAPPSVASGLQRVGRAGHQVGAVSHGVFFPKFRGDLVASAVIVERMRAGAIEQLRVPANPLDVLAQQLVAMVALDDWSVDELFDLVRRSAPFAGLTRGVLESVLDMLAGRYPSEDFAELRPRLVWDRVTGTLSGRRGAQRIAVTSGGTIPDRGLFGVFIAGDGPGRRVGELDEEMVYESRVGDVITLGTSTWRIENITADQVLVTPAPGEPGRLPFWKGDTLGRPLELGQAVGSFVREVSSLDAAAASERLRGAGLDAWASDNLLAYLSEQQQATGRLPHDTQLVVERFTDELGDWRIVIHSPFGAPVHAPWALAIAARMRERYGVDVQAMHADDGIVLRLPDLGGSDPWDADGWGSGWGDTAAADFAAADGGGGDSGAKRHHEQPMADLLDLILLDPDEIAQIVTDEVGGSALFASRFRECAGRALLLPKRRPDKRQALWQQRQRSAQLLSVASQYPAFPIVLEAVRECLQDVFDLPGLVELMRRVRTREVSVVEVTTPTPSPFASSLLFGYVAQFMYEGDAPLAEKRAAALSLDPDLLAELLGTSAGLSLRELLDPAAIARTHDELQHLAENRRARDADEVTDLLRVLGPLTTEEIVARSIGASTSSANVPVPTPVVGALDETPTTDHPAGDAAETPVPEPVEEALARTPNPESATTPIPEPVEGWLAALSASGRIFRARVGAREVWAGIEDAGRLRDALGVPLPRGVPDVFAAPTVDPLGELLTRYARTHVPFTLDEAASWLGLGRAIVADGLRRLIAEGRVVEGEFRPDAATREFCDPGVLRTIRRRSVAALRAEVEPVPQADYGRFLPAWQGVGGQLRGAEGVLRAIEQLAGVVLPASAVESLILPARVRDYAPALLDELCAAGEVVWRGHGSLAGRDGWVSLYPAELADLAASDALPEGELQVALHAALADGGAYFFGALAAAAPPASEASVSEALWELVWKGLVTNDTVAPLRARLGAGTTTHRTPRAAPRGRYGRVRTSVPRRSAPPDAGGRWSALPSAPLRQAQGPSGPLPASGLTNTERLLLTSELLLDRYGVLTRGSVQAEEIEGGFAGVYRVLSAAEDAGRVRRGYFVEGLGAAQFATVGAIDRLRGAKPQAPLVLAAADPANPYGAALAWSATVADSPHKPARKAGAMVVLADGEPVVYLERGGHTALTWTDDPAVLASAARELALLIQTGRLASITVEKIDGKAALGGDQPLVPALLDAGFRLTPKGIRLRR
ncbi:DEAD/DEAH box helicase [Propioniciclava tarda]|uniref:DEAD/DEAH box helicase n=2 Tax=Propioniciclava tarda TaxID=433330 RepID=A0A4Q9KMD3_PROTD|nr:DEAD/DEAH box helicase [Propioniciclava tarda]